MGLFLNEKKRRRSFRALSLILLARFYESFRFFIIIAMTRIAAMIQRKWVFLILVVVILLIFIGLG